MADFKSLNNSMFEKPVDAKGDNKHQSSLSSNNLESVTDNQDFSRKGELSKASNELVSKAASASAVDAAAEAALPDASASASANGANKRMVSCGLELISKQGLAGVKRMKKGKQAVATDPENSSCHDKTTTKQQKRNACFKKQASQNSADECTKLNANGMSASVKEDANGKSLAREFSKASDKKPSIGHSDVSSAELYSATKTSAFNDAGASASALAGASAVASSSSSAYQDLSPTPSSPNSSLLSCEQSQSADSDALAADAAVAATTYKANEADCAKNPLKHVKTNVKFSTSAKFMMYNHNPNLRNTNDVKLCSVENTSDEISDVNGEGSASISTSVSTYGSSLYAVASTATSSTLASAATSSVASSAVADVDLDINADNEVASGYINSEYEDAGDSCEADLDADLSEYACSEQSTYSVQNAATLLESELRKSAGMAFGGGFAARKEVVASLGSGTSNGALNGSGTANGSANVSNKSCGVGESCEPPLSVPRDELLEQRQHGTRIFPIDCHHWDSNRGPCYGIWHWHNEVEIVHVLKGHDLKLHVVGQSFSFNAPAIILIPGGVLHRCEFDSEDGKANHTIFDPKVLELSRFDEAQANMLEALSQGVVKQAAPILRGDPGFERLNVLLDFMDEYAKHQEAGMRLQLKGCLLQILGILYQYGYLNKSPLDRLSENTSREQRIKELFQYIFDNYNHPLSIMDVSMRMGVTKTYFCRLFKSLTGLSFVDYLNLIRLSRAAQEIVLTSGPINDIIERHGFESSSYFFKLFKQKFNCTPNTFRQNKGTVDSHKVNLDFNHLDPVAETFLNR